uniref:Uncharacterized protein n=1 Tax=Acrobeloides nanus TaxID=290746 RepID=A0A914CMJ4_9BILA
MGVGEEGCSPVRNVPETFLSVAFDSANEEVDNWVGLNWTFVQPLAQALTPAYFRLGGTRADFLLFKENATSSLGVLS